MSLRAHFHQQAESCEALGSPPAAVAGRTDGTGADRFSLSHHRLAVFPRRHRAGLPGRHRPRRRKSHTAGAFAWLSFEMDDQRPGAPVLLRLWPGDIVLPLGRMDFHGCWFHFA